MENKDRFLFPEDRISLTVFNTYGLERASFWSYTQIRYVRKGKSICLPCRRSWHLHQAALSICPSLFPQQSLLEWWMLATQNTGAYSPKAHLCGPEFSFGGASSAPDLFTSDCPPARGQLPAHSQNCLSETQQPKHLHLKHTPMGQQQWSPLRSQV